MMILILIIIFLTLEEIIKSDVQTMLRITLLGGLNLLRKI